MKTRLNLNVNHSNHLPVQANRSIEESVDVQGLTVDVLELEGRWVFSCVVCFQHTLFGEVREVGRKIPRQ